MCIGMFLCFNSQIVLFFDVHKLTELDYMSYIS